MSPLPPLVQYCRYGGNHLLVPASKEEEVVLLLLLAEAMASKHVPLNQTPEFDTIRSGC